MKEGWKKVRLGEVAEFKYGKGLPERNRIVGEFPVYGSGGMVGYHNEYLVEGPGIIVGRKGTIGSVFFEKRSFYPIDTVFYIEEIKQGTDKKFLYYMLLNLKLNKLNSDAAVPGLNRNIAYQQQVVFPPLSTQNKISSILSAYDDLIENNNRRIKILEEMAQSIYREWFINFRFPEHEKVKMVDSELGKIPEGWEVRRLSDVCNIIMGQSPKSEFYNTTGEGLPFHQGVKDFGKRFPNHLTYCTIENRIAERGDILISVRAPVGRINIANTRLIIGRGLSAIRHRDNLQSFLYYQMKNIFLEENTMGSGSIFNAIIKEDLYKLKFLLPDKELDKNFDTLISPIDREIENLSQKNTNLRYTRDLLLPKLISGEIDVKKLSIDTGSLLR